MKLINADSLDALAELEPDSLDSMVTDPPAGISFMAKDWDSASNFDKSMKLIFLECIRVLKPGAHALVWAIPRTSHKTAQALEDAGFEIRDVITHIFGSGFPKSLDVSKAIDKMYGAEREVVGKNPSFRPNHVQEHERYNARKYSGDDMLTVPSTSAAKQWSGFGTALKPASEHWILCRKPLGEKTVAKNVIKHGTGGLNIDECRIGFQSEADRESAIPFGQMAGSNVYAGNSLLSSKTIRDKTDITHTQGRFPANLIVDESAVEELDEQSGLLKSGSGQKSKNRNSPCHDGGFKPDEKEFESSQGGASRYFYCPKASKRDRNEGLEGMQEKSTGRFQANRRCKLCGYQEISGSPCKCENPEWEKIPVKDALNFHPTVKSTKLMEYLIKLVTPPGGTVLDPFMGSGSTGVAAKRLGFKFIGIEKEKEYFDIAEKRIQNV